MKIFSGSANKPFAEKLASKLDLSLSSLEIHTFPDGEKRIQVVDPVLGEDCVVVQSTSIPVDVHYMELFFIIDALKRSGAKNITVVMPYVGYQRQDHVFRSGEAVSLEVTGDILSALGANRIITSDLHSIKIPELFHTPVVEVSALPLFAKEIQKMPDASNAFLVSPDMGGIRRIKIISELLGGMPYVAIEKNRDLTSGQVTAGVVHGIELQKGKKQAIMVDDMISSGKTVVMDADLLAKHGVEDITVFATHAVFSENAPSLLTKSNIKKVYVTDSVAVLEKRQFPKLEIISIAGIIAESLLS